MENLVEEANKEFGLAQAVFSYSDITDSINYAFRSVVVDPSEVGMDVYSDLIHEKVLEYLNQEMGSWE